MKDKKKLKKSIESFERLLKEHEEKLRKAQKNGRWDLTAYYPKEISKFRKEMQKKAKKLEKN
ncbi:MAG: hypothetical protein AB1467_03195 [Candidatus Diapherotrites archaeon]